MVKLKGPGHAIAASGALADTVIFSTCKGRAYLKTHATPTNPRSGTQTSVRVAMTFLSQVWQSLSLADQGTWISPAFDQNTTPYHAFIRENQKRWRTFRTPSKRYPAAEAPPAVFTTRLWNIAVGYRMVTHTITHTGDNYWGFVIFRELDHLYTPSLQNAIALIPRAAGNTSTWIDTPIKPGSYRYMFAVFTATGVSIVQPTLRYATIT